MIIGIKYYFSLSNQYLSILEIYCILLIIQADIFYFYLCCLLALDLHYCSKVEGKIAQLFSTLIIIRNIS